MALCGVVESIFKTFNFHLVLLILDKKNHPLFVRYNLHLYKKKPLDWRTKLNTINAEKIFQTIAMPFETVILLYWYNLFTFQIILMPFNTLISFKTYFFAILYFCNAPLFQNSYLHKLLTRAEFDNCYTILIKRQIP